MFMGDGFDVHLDALKSFGQVLTAQGDRMQQVNAALSGASVSGDAFGKLPNSGSMHANYTAHAEAEVQNSADMAQILAGIGEALSAMADAYQAVDQEVQQTLQAISTGSGAS
jgi:hypothetical protein